MWNCISELNLDAYVSIAKHSEISSAYESLSDLLWSIWRVSNQLYRDFFACRENLLLSELTFGTGTQSRNHQKGLNLLMNFSFGQVNIDLDK